MNRKKKIKTILAISSLIIIITAIIIAGKLIEKYTPSKERMPYTEYFAISADEMVVTMNNQRIEADVVVEEEVIYVPLIFVQEQFNKRFYLDIHDNYLMYTTADTVYSYETDSNTYTDLEGNSYTEDYVIVKNIDGTLYLALDYVKKYADFDYRYYVEPARLLMWNEYGTATYVSPTDTVAMRFAMDIKSDIIRDVIPGEEVEILDTYEEDGWFKVRSEDGYTGYIQDRLLNTSFERALVSDFVPEAKPESISFKSKINLVWHVLGVAAGGEKVSQSLAGTKGINVISPTWYSITSNDGDVSSFANKSYVDKCHEMGIMVWPLIDDFNTEIDGLTIYSDRETRTRLIERIISDSREYGYDGINIDFEKVTDESAVHYLQFIRELSLACEKEELVLSIDNYVPAAHNMHYDRTEQGIWADYIVIMGYDEHWSGSDAGSVASIGFVRKGIEDTLLEVPAEKVINAMPFYTRIWVETPNADGTVNTTSKAVGMETAYNTVKESGYPAIWNEECAQYYCAYDYAEGDSTVKIWLEEAHSIEEKMKLFDEFELAGVAAWRLGFETLDVWDVILKYIQ